MKITDLLAALAIGTIVGGCNAERKQECDRFLSALKPLESKPSADEVDRMQTSLLSAQFQDQPLREYGASTKATLQVLANSLKTQAAPDAPDGTDDLVKAKIKEARGERDDVARYCSQ
jgi:hypothetical protein